MALSLEDIANATKSVASRFDVERVYLFGSYARSEATDMSDVDLCLETGESFSLFNAGSFVADLEHRLKTSVDVVSQNSLYDFARKGYLEDRILLYERL